MRTLGFWILPLTGLFLAACDGGETTGSGGTGGSGGDGGGATTTSSTTTSSSTTTTTSSTTTTTTMTVPGCAGGQQLVLGELVEGDLSQPKQEDYYRFQGFKGQVLWIDVDAQDLDGVQFDPSYIDTVVSLYTLDDKKLAQNNNPTEFSTADSRLYTILPEDGTYCIRVAECHTVFSASNCYSDPARISNTFYEMNVFELFDDGPGDSNTADPEGGNDPTTAPDVDFVKASSGNYFSAYIWGYYETADDIDVFKFALPPDVPVPFDARAQFNVTAFRPGVTGSGSTTATGEIVIVDPDTPDLPIARVDPGKSTDLQVPLALGKEYWMFVNRPAGTPEDNDFYFLSAFPGWGNPLEIDDAGNTSFATAEKLSFSSGTSAFIAGDISPIADLDHFVADVPAGNTQVTGVCAARTRGSGLRQMKITLLGQNGMPLSAAATSTETSTALAFAQNIPVGANTKVVLKVEAAMQAADASGAYYQCGLHFSKP